MNTTPITVTHEDGATEEVTVKQLSISQYQAAYTDFDNEFGFVATTCAKDEAWVMTLAPASYEYVFTTAKELNQNFQAYAEREGSKIKSRLQRMDPELLKAARQLFNSSPRPR